MATKSSTKPKTKPTTEKWSAKVTATSDAMDVAAGTFKQRSAKKIAEAVEHDAEKSTRKKADSYRSAMSALTFYINRAGSNLSPARRKVLEQAKDVLRAEFGPDAAKPAKKTTLRKTGTRKKPGKARG
jgi:hypothetical protein